MTTLVEADVGTRDHRSNVKSFTVQPPVATPDGFALLVSVLDQHTQERLIGACRAAAGTSLRFGEMDVQLGWDEPPLVRQDDYTDLRSDVAPESPLLLEFRSPTVFRSGKKRLLAEPVPTQVFGHYRARWNHFAPVDVACNLAFDDLGLAAAHAEVRQVPYRDGHRRGGRLVEVEFTGFVGRVWFEATGPGADGESVGWLHTLARFGSYCGTGANTTIGMGATQYLGSGEEVRGMMHPTVEARLA